MTDQLSDEVLLLSPRPEHAEAIVQVIRAGFKREPLDLTIYGSPQVALWVAAHLEIPAHAAERVYKAASVGGELVGAIEVAPRSDCLFLSYVSVLPGYRHRGVGSRLLNAVLDYQPSQSPALLRLDVLAGNALALDWYRHLGFEHAGQRLMCDASRVLPGPALAGHVLGLPAADAAHERYGFSEFRIETDRGTTRIGRLTHRWWRLTDEGVEDRDMLDDQELLSTLRALDPKRGLLVVSGGQTPSHGTTTLFRTLRLESALDELRRRLP